MLWFLATKKCSTLATQVKKLNKFCLFQQQKQQNNQTDTATAEK